MTYLYVDYPYYKKYMYFATISAVITFVCLLTLIVPFPVQLQHFLPQQEHAVRDKVHPRSAVHDL
jgi:hypothetical protein